MVTNSQAVQLRTFIAVIAVVIGAVGSVCSYAVAVAWEAKTLALSARPDPFTGAMGREMEAKLIDRDRNIMDQIRRECTLTSQRFDAEIAQVRSEIKRANLRIDACVDNAHRLTRKYQAEEDRD